MNKGERGCLYPSGCSVRGMNEQRVGLEDVRKNSWRSYVEEEDLDISKVIIDSWGHVDEMLGNLRKDIQNSACENCPYK